MTYETTFMALAEPSRRRVFERLRLGPLSVRDIADKMPVSRPAVSQHLKILKDAGLVRDRVDGARRLYSIEPLGLESLRTWLDGFWDDALVAFKEAAEREPVKKRILK